VCVCQRVCRPHGEVLYWSLKNSGLRCQRLIQQRLVLALEFTLVGSKGGRSRCDCPIYTFPPFGVASLDHQPFKQGAGYDMAVSETVKTRRPCAYRWAGWRSPWALLGESSKPFAAPTSYFFSSPSTPMYELCQGTLRDALPVVGVVEVVLGAGGSSRRKFLLRRPVFGRALPCECTAGEHFHQSTIRTASRCVSFCLFAPLHAGSSFVE